MGVTKDKGQSKPEVIFSNADGTFERLYFNKIFPNEQSDSSAAKTIKVDETFAFVDNLLGLAIVCTLKKNELGTLNKFVGASGFWFELKSLNLINNNLSIILKKGGYKQSIKLLIQYFFRRFGVLYGAVCANKSSILEVNYLSGKYAKASLMELFDRFNDTNKAQLLEIGIEELVGISSKNKTTVEAALELVTPIIQEGYTAGFQLRRGVYFSNLATSVDVTGALRRVLTQNLVTQAFGPKK